MRTKTSQTSPIGINKITPEYGQRGWIAITLAPGKKTKGGRNYWDRDLAADLDRLVELGTTVLVCFLEDDELVSLRIPHLVEQATARGLEVKRFPFHDGRVPSDMERTLRLVREICRLYHDGQRIVMHCNGGLGRAGTMGACVRLALGLDRAPAQAIVSIRRARGRRAIETRGQEAFISRFLHAWRSQDEDNSWPTDDERVAAAERRRGGWYGLAVGDALGAPLEFMSAEAIADRFGQVHDMQAGGPWQAGEWTDDTALAICTASAYADPSEGFLPNQAVSCMLQWYQAGPKDIGNQTRLALELLAGGIPPSKVAKEIKRRHPLGAGNGSLMRAAPTGLVRWPEDPRLIEESLQLSSFTHPDERCTSACAVFNVALATLVFKGPDPGQALEAAAAAAVGLHREVAELVQGVLEHRPPRYADMPIGYVLLCLEQALLALRDAGSFEQGLVKVVNQGGDSDTNGAVAGALLGARFGYQGIPRRWLQALRGRQKLARAHDWLVKTIDYRAVFDMDLPF